MKRSKIIGLVTTNLMEEDAFRTFEMIHKYAYQNNYGVVTFYPGKDWDDEAQKENISTLYMIDYSKIDAFIVDGDKVRNSHFIDEFAKKAKAAGKPVIVINAITNEAVCVVSTVEDSFKEIVTHIVEHHGCKRVDFMAGYRDRFNTSMLIDIYKKVLQDNDIPIDERRVVYGEYYGQPAIEAFGKLMEVDVPDAIVCANDTMAIIVQGQLKKRGLECPKNVLVTGIDGSIRGEYRSPSITTAKKDYDTIAKTAVVLSGQAMEGMKLDSVYRVPSVTIFGQSCGCEDSKVVDFSKHMDDLYEQREANITFDLTSNYVSEKLIHATKLDDVSAVIDGGLPNNAYFCVRDSFMQDVLRDRMDGENWILTDKFFVIADTTDRKVKWKAFELGDICPDFGRLIDMDVPIIVAPVNYKDIQYGYMVIAEKKFELFSCLLDKYVMNFNLALGKYVIERKLLYVSDELSRSNVSMSDIQVRDILTGMLNSKGFIQEMDQYKLDCNDRNRQLILACVDIDGLNNINDIYGHSEGDVAIQTLASIIKDGLGDGDICAHLGSDEFVVAMSTTSNPESYAESFFNALSGRVFNYNSISTKEYSIEINYAASSVLPNENTDIQALLEAAISKKRMIKFSRRDIVGFMGDGYELQDERQKQLVSEVLAGNMLYYVFQPIVDAKTGSIYGYEALMRARTDEDISPMAVINQATKDDRLYEIEHATFFNVLKRVDENKEIIGDKKIFINSLPGYQLEDVDYSKIEHKYKELFDNLVVEITEQGEMDDDGFDLLRERCMRGGFKLAIDDYGSGFSNPLMLLKTMPDYVKIDRLLISGIENDPKKQHFVRSIVTFAHDNGFLALAEGVETQNELSALIHMGIDLIQGFYTAKPKEEIIAEIPEHIKNEIIDTNNAAKPGSHRKMYIVNKEKEISLTRISLEGYNGMIVSQPEISIIGNLDYVADMHIRIKDGTDCKIVLRNVHLSNVDKLPCIDVGNNARLTLVLEEDNIFDGIGICVPHTAKLRISGKGNLMINASHMQSYCIGNEWTKAFGEIEVGTDGTLVLNLTGNRAVGIGGGIYKDGYGVRIVRGRLEFMIEGVTSIGIGSITGEAPILMRDCNISMDMRVSAGIGIGVWNGQQDIDMQNVLINIIGSGNVLSGIGSVEGEFGKVRLHSAHISMELSGKRVYGIGNLAGGMDVALSNFQFDYHGEGKSVLGIGSYDRNGLLSMVDGLINMEINSEDAYGIKAAKENVMTNRITKSIVINGYESEW